jgi:predicted nucleic acid-binding protein
VGFSVVWVRWRAFPAIDFHDCYLAARALDTPGETVYSLDGDFKKLL